MGITPKSVQEIMDASMKELMKSLEAGMYDSPMLPHETGVRRVLGRLGIKSAERQPAFGGVPLIFESIEAVLRGTTFDVGDLKLWDDLTKK